MAGEWRLLDRAPHFKKALDDVGIDARQIELQAALVNLSDRPVTEGRCPTEYNGTGIRFQDPKTNKWFYATFEVIPSSFEEFQEEDTEEIICGQRVVNSRDRLHLLEGKIKFSRTIFITCQKRTFLRGPHVNFFFGLQLFLHFFGAQPPIKRGRDRLF